MAGPHFVVLLQTPHQTLKLFTPAGTQELAIPELDAKRGGRLDADLRRLLLEQLELQRAAGRSERLRLLLHESLPPAWHDFPWEEIQLEAQALAEYATIVRQARWRGKTGRGRHEAGFLSLFPPAEHDFLRALQSPIAAGQLARIKHFPHALARYRDVFIFAHGDANGLLDTEGAPFAWPDAGDTPECVWLLACNHDQAMDRLARQLLQAGVRTVIAARGELSAPGMAELSIAWLGDGRPEPSRWLAARHDRSAGGAQTLVVWGEVELDGAAEPVRRWNYTSWLEANDALLALPLHDTTPRESFDEAAGAFFDPDCWPVTRQLLAPALSWLAEKHDHKLMQKLRPYLDADNSIEAHRAQASTNRRLGHFPLAARHLVQALLARPDNVDLHARLWAALANLLIDLNLPAATTAALHEQENIYLPDSDAQDLMHFKRLDMRARCHARQGKLPSALDCLHSKQNSPFTDGVREKIGRLYHMAWHAAALPQEDALAAELLCWLAASAEDSLGDGNEITAYLLRALAAHYWKTGKDELLVGLERWQETIEERLSSTDPGPWAYITLFIALRQHDSAQIERAVDALERAYYLLEAALFLGLAGQHAAGQRFLQRFQASRAHCLEELAKLSGAVPAAAGAELAARMAAEEAALHNPAQMALSGVVPL